LMRSGWPGDAEQNPALIDPMCGSGTLLIEGALMALGVPANAHRETFGVDALQGVDLALWSELRAEAESARAAAHKQTLPRRLYGSDADAEQLRCAQAQSRRAGVLRHINYTQADIKDLVAPKDAPRGMLITNPPFGERLGGAASSVRALMGTLGQALGALSGYTSHVLVADPEMGFALGLRAHKTHSILHGPLACTLLHLKPQAVRASSRAHDDVLLNRLQKNVRGLKAYLKEQNITAYRLYDADLPDYSVAVDIYEDTQGQRHAHVQEYAAPADVPESLAQSRLRRVLEAVGEVMDIGPHNMALKVRRRQRAQDQYGKDEARRITSPARRPKAKRTDGFWVMEGGLKYFVDLHSYVDTGLFLDHRRVRAWMAKNARGKSLLNLFGYTGSVSVAAAHGGAQSTHTVDLSATYLAWAEDNLDANGLLHERNRLIQADCLEFISQNATRRYDLAFVNPPTFSNSKRMDTEFDLVRDHATLLDATMAWVKDDGVALFSTHARRLRMDETLLQRYAITEITKQVRPKDFDRAKNGCRAWLIRHKGPA
jgi:23S rRNA (guanine2445-N2)-methyltransferase / 23S rRNA (guanine2069-N7)-methyltransferase